jgi:hypothetical protein
MLGPIWRSQYHKHDHFVGDTAAISFDLSRATLSEDTSVFGVVTMAILATGWTVFALTAL